MYGIAVEYDRSGCAPANPLLREARRAAMVRQPGYRRRLALQADGWRRVVDLFLFATPEAATAALASGDWGEQVAAAGCGQTVMGVWLFPARPAA